MRIKLVNPLIKFDIMVLHLYKIVNVDLTENGYIYIIK